jgi:hypothetical protein
MRAILSALVLAATACSSVPEHQGRLPTFEANAESVGVGGLWLGMPHRTAEQTLGSALPIREGFAEACGSGHSEVTISGRRVTVQWADNSPREIESIFVSLPAQAFERSFENLSTRAGSYLNRCGVGSPTAPHCFQHRGNMVVYGDPDLPQPGIWLSLEDCTD